MFLFEYKVEIWFSSHCVGMSVRLEHKRTLTKIGSQFRSYLYLLMLK